MTELYRDLELLHNQPDSWQPIKLDTLPEKPPVQPELADTGLIYPGLRHVFSGPPESAKTIAAYCVLIQNARHGDIGILIDFEMGIFDARSRLRELGCTHDELELILYLSPSEPATTARIASLVAYHPTLVIVDAAVGAYHLEGLDDNKRGDVEKIARLYVNTFWRAGIATLFIDHVVKNTEARGRFQIGSERKLGGTDTHIGFDTVKPVSRGTTGHYKLIVHKDRGGYLKRGHLVDLKLDSDPETHQISWAFTDPEVTIGEGGYFRPTHLMEKVSINLETRSEPVSRNTVCDELGGTKDYVLKAISALVTEGFVTEEDGPRRSKLLTSVRRYREDNPVDNPEPNTTQPLVREWFGSGSANQCEVSGSVVRPPYGDDTTRPHHSDHPKPDDWFGANGTLDSYYDEIAPDPEDEP